MKKRIRRIAQEMGAGVLTAAALAAVATYLLSNKKQKAKMKTWAVNAKKEVVKRVKQAKRLSEGEYKHIVDQAMKRYGSLNKVDRAEIARIARDMKGEWRRIKKIVIRTVKRR
jgi:hypothetical protein